MCGIKANRIKVLLFCLGYFFCGFVCLSGIAGATTYYVDFDNGNDTSNGLGTNSSWRNLPGTCSTESSSSAACSYLPNRWAVLNAGDVIRIKSGTTKDSSDGGRIHISSTFYAPNATVAKSITIQRDTAWGSGSVTFDGRQITLPSGGWGLIHIRQLGGIKFDGVEGVTNPYDGMIVQNAQYCGISSHPGSGAVSYEGCMFQFMKFKGNCTAYSNIDNASDGQLRLYSHNGGYVDYCEFDGMNYHTNNISAADSDVRLINFTISNSVGYNLVGTDDADSGISFKAQNSQITFVNVTAYNCFKGFDLGENEGVTTWDVTYKLVRCTAYQNAFGANFSLKGFEGPWSGKVDFFVINSIIRDNNSIGTKAYAGPYNLYIIHSIYANNNINVCAHVDGLDDANLINVYIYNSILYKPSGPGGINYMAGYWNQNLSRFSLFMNYNSLVQNTTEYFARWGYWGSNADKKDYSYGPNGPGHSSGEWFDDYGHNSTRPPTGALGHHNVGTNNKGTGASDPTLPPFKDAASHDFLLTGNYRGIALTGMPWYIPEMGVDRNGMTRKSWDIGPYEYRPPNESVTPPRRLRFDPA